MIDIAVRDLKKEYEVGQPVLDGLTFQVDTGERVGILGRNGAGKTTLINLLMRFYEVDGGQILLDGVDTAAMTRENLRDNFGMVLQDTWLFDGTIAENIAYGKPDATREEIIAAAPTARTSLSAPCPKGMTRCWGARRRTSPWGSGSCSPSPGWSFGTHRCSSWTRPPPAWIPAQRWRLEKP